MSAGAGGWLVGGGGGRRTDTASRASHITLQGDSYVQLSVAIEGYIDYINPYYIPRDGGTAFALRGRRAVE